MHLWYLVEICMTAVTHRIVCTSLKEALILTSYFVSLPTCDAVGITASDFSDLNHLMAWLSGS